MHFGDSRDIRFFVNEDLLLMLFGTISDWYYPNAPQSLRYIKHVVSGLKCEWSNLSVCQKPLIIIAFMIRLTLAMMNRSRMTNCIVRILDLGSVKVMNDIEDGVIHEVLGSLAISQWAKYVPATAERTSIPVVIDFSSSSVPGGRCPVINDPR
jgi:hypothetical protein